MNDYLDIATAAKRMGLDQRSVRRKCEAGELAGAIKEGHRWKIPRTAHPKLSQGPENMVDSPELAGVPERKRTEALRRLGMIQEFNRFERELARAEGGRVRSTAVALYMAEHDVTERSLWRWLAAYKNDGLIGLVDNRGGGRFVSEIISPEAFEQFKGLYLDQRRPTVAQCWRNLCYINKDEERGWRVPTVRAMYAVKDSIPLAVRILHREGLAAYEAKCAPYIERDEDSVEPGQVWIGDHCQLNCWIRRRGRWIRPWLTAWQDLRSRQIVGIHISASPNQTTILLAMKRGIEQYGPPELAKVDNGRDYASEMWTGKTKKERRALKRGYLDEQMVAGIYAMMGVGVSFAIPYHPQAKGTLERFFDTMDRQLVNTLPTYCGKDTQRRPDYLKDLLNNETHLKEAYDLDSFDQVVGRYIEVYNKSAHSGRGMDGRSPAAVFETRGSRRVMAEGVLELLMRVWSKELKVGKNGVRIKGIYYGQYNADLLMQQGKKVRAAYDPDDMREVSIYAATTLRLLTIAEQNQLIRYADPVSEDDLRQAMRQKNRALKLVRGQRDAQLTVNMDLTSLTLRAMADAAEKTKPAAEHRQKTIKPVRTPLDDQVREHERQKVIKAVKRASGAESLKTVLDCDFSLLRRSVEDVDVDIDLSLLRPNDEVDLDLFNDDK